MSEEFKNYRDLEPGDQLITGDEFRWEGQWKCVYKQLEHYPKYVTRGIRHRRPIGPSEAKLRGELSTAMRELAEAKVEIARLRKHAELCKSTVKWLVTPDTFEPSVERPANWASKLQSLREQLASVTAERDQLKAENEKLRATVAAKDEAITVLCDAFNENRCNCETQEFQCQYCTYRSAALSLGKRAPSPEIANEFVRREVLEAMIKPARRACELLHGSFTEKALIAAISRAETELTKGKLP